MKISKRYIFIIVMILVIVTAGFEGVSKWQDYIANKPKSEIKTENNLKLIDNQIKLLQSLVGLESKKMKIVDNPLRIEGEFKVPEKTVLSMVKYYLDTSKNKEIEDVRVNIDNKNIRISAKYKLLKSFKTPIEISIEPSLTKSSHVKLHINDIKILGFSIDDNLIDAIVESWFSNMDGIRVTNGDVTIDKNNFEDITIKNITMESKNLAINLSMKLE